MKPPKPSLMKALDTLHRNRKRGLSLTQLVQRTGLSPDCIRGRISEMKKAKIPIVKVGDKYCIKQGADIELE